MINTDNFTKTLDIFKEDNAKDYRLAKRFIKYTSEQFGYEYKKFYILDQSRELRLKKFKNIPPSQVIRLANAFAAKIIHDGHQTEEQQLDFLLKLGKENATRANQQRKETTMSSNVAEIRKEPRERDCEYVKTHYLDMLYSKGLTATEIGEYVGRTGSAINNYLRDGKATKVVEVAACCMWKERYESKEHKNVTTAFIKIKKEHLGTIKLMVETLGGNFAEFDLK